MKFWLDGTSNSASTQEKRCCHAESPQPARWLLHRLRWDMLFVVCTCAAWGSGRRWGGKGHRFLWETDERTLLSQTHTQTPKVSTQFWHWSPRGITTCTPHSLCFPSPHRKAPELEATGNFGETKPYFRHLVLIQQVPKQRRPKAQANAFQETKEKSSWDSFAPTPLTTDAPTFSRCGPWTLSIRTELSRTKGAPALP